ncbi:exopolyphosphatase [Verticiella sediminum]|uniref:Exopolyphosphatase n=1 Tax=Verticiella sediminum TaxID=1247510 RepID=A0A556AQD0_9BURK|nr:exopolyphosphatase [Verticiella sediminum]TSH95128.1 exopolyphosphatase [Verticiella sediminum]
MTHMLAGVDLGSNSFRLAIGRVVYDDGVPQVYQVDRLKETVRLAAGLDDDQVLDEATIARAVAVLERFGERLRSFDPDRVRAVATNTFRVARNVEELHRRAEAALGFPIEVIAGREEARLIFAGVAHSLPGSPERRFIVDIGGGSTECIVGTGFEPELMESLPMGCVSYSRRFFPDGRVDRDRMLRAELAAREQVQGIARTYRRLGWTAAYGSSGTAKALAAILPATGLSEAGITREGLHRLRERLIDAGSVDAAKLLDIKPDRAAVLPGGLAIMRAAFDELGIETMQTADGALRVGVLYDLLGREAEQDKRAHTVRQFMVRYEVDQAQAARVRASALALYRDVTDKSGQRADADEVAQLLGWAAELHECGLSISHSSHHTHAAYILGHADMPGFSSSEQQLLATLCLGHYGKLTRPEFKILSPQHWLALLCLRLGCLLCRRREDLPAPPLRAVLGKKQVHLQVQADWLAEHPLTDYSLRSEAEEWAKAGHKLTIDAQ